MLATQEAGEAGDVLRRCMHVRLPMQKGSMAANAHNVVQVPDLEVRKA